MRSPCDLRVTRDLLRDLRLSPAAHLDLVRQVRSRFPEMFKPSERCRVPHMHKDTLRNKCIALADKWVAGGEECTTSEEWDAMNTGQRITVLEYLQDVQAANKADDKLTHDIAAIARMDKLYVA